MPSSSASMPAGILPSLSAFSRTVISCSVFAFLTMRSTRFLSLSLMRTLKFLPAPLRAGAAEV